MPKSRGVKYGTILEALETLGLEPEDPVFVHSSLACFGWVEGGAETVCRVVADAVGPEGTVIMPAFTFRLRDIPEPVLDPAREPSCVGRVSETFRTRFATHRSLHITHSVSAAGALAGYFTEGRCRDAFDEDSPFRRLVDSDGKVLLLGVDYNRCTFFHAIESALPVPYLGMTPKPDASLLLPDGSIVPADCSVHLPTEDYDFNRIADLLEKENLVRTRACGDALLRCFRAAPVFERVLKELRKDPFGLVMGEKRVEIPVAALRNGRA